MNIYFNCLKGIVYKELIRFFKQKSRFFSALIRPLLWLCIFSIGLKPSLELILTSPYEKAVDYETYIIPGLVGMVILFNGMQSSLTMIFDREMGSMKILLASYINRNYLIFCKMFATSIVSTIQALTFLIVARIYGIEISFFAIILTIPLIILSSIILNAFALFLSSVIKELENFASVMNFVIFPMFFLSSALYPLSQIKEASFLIYKISCFNPFTYMIEAIRYSLYFQIDMYSLLILFCSFIVSLVIAFLGFKVKKVNK